MIFNKINKLGRDRVPFFFSIDFAVKNAIIFPLEDLSKEGICIYFNGKSYGEILNIISHNKYNISFKYISLDNYRESFNKVQEGINNGDSYLLNLTFPTEAISDISLEEVYLAANAKYKVYVKDKFVFFSPESFIKIYDNKIFSYPMKGTIDASIPSAELLLLDNEKELFEHYTIVDLIRNDLSLVSSNVGVEKFRYIDKVKTANGRDILQTSSKISGDIDSNWKDNIGNILKELLPAGSISGAPKLKTLEIINFAELDDRGFYTGVSGVFNGDSLDTCVNIRFLERVNDNKYIYRSGGGVTCKSNCDDEYNELITKVYVPQLY